MKERMDLPSAARRLNLRLQEIESAAGESSDLVRDIRFELVDALTALENDMAILSGRR
jgi:hypothetical protein